MTELIILCGLPGCGKSTLASLLVKNYGENVCTIVSRDEIRFSMLKEGDSYFKNEKKVFKKFTDEINEALKTKEIVIADATHISKASRKKLLNKIENKSNLTITALYIDTSLEECLRRNETRTGIKKVPKEAIISMNEKLEIPDEREEMIDEVELWRCKSHE